MKDLYTESHKSLLRERLEKTQTDGKISHVHGLEGSIVGKGQEVQAEETANAKASIMGMEKKARQLECGEWGQRVASVERLSVIGGVTRNYLLAFNLGVSAQMCCLVLTGLWGWETQGGQSRSHSPMKVIGWRGRVWCTRWCMGGTPLPAQPLGLSVPNEHSKQPLTQVPLESPVLLVCSSGPSVISEFFLWFREEAGVPNTCDSHPNPSESPEGTHSSVFAVLLPPWTVHLLLLTPIQISLVLQVLCDQINSRN